MVQEVVRMKERREDGERWRQYVSSLTILCVTVLVGLPLWWRTTEVYRCPLPYSEIQTLSKQQVPPVLTYTVSVAVLDNEGEESSFVARLHQELSNHTVRADDLKLTLSYLVQPLPLDHVERERVKKAIHSNTPLASILPPSSLGHYSILVVTGDGPSKVTLSSERWAVVHTGTDTLSGVSGAVEAVRSMVTNEQQLRQVLETTSGRGRGRGSGREDVEGMRRVRAAQGYHLSLTLLVPDPSQATVDWNIESATEDVLVPFLNHPGISSIGNFTVSSQVFHYMDVKFIPKKSKTGGYYIQSTSLPPMISSVEAKLGSLVSQLPSLNFLVLVPHHTHSPLLIRDPQGEYTDNFLVPQWGGVVFYNPPQKVDSEEGGSGEVRVEMREVMAVFVRQLQMLLGIPTYPQSPSSPEVVLERGNLNITEWQMDQLLVARMLEFVSTGSTSLISLIELLDKVKNMVISDVIQQEVEASLSHLQECYRSAERGDLEGAYSHARIAMGSAERAFFDPSILELLYFPDDQKFAIYIPLFLPISIPIAMSSVAAFRWVTAALRTSHTDKQTK